MVRFQNSRLIAQSSCFQVWYHGIVSYISSPFVANIHVRLPFLRPIFQWYPSTIHANAPERRTTRYHNHWTSSEDHGSRLSEWEIFVVWKSASEWWTMFEIRKKQTQRGVVDGECSETIRRAWRSRLKGRMLVYGKISRKQLREDEWNILWFERLVHWTIGSRGHLTTSDLSRASWRMVSGLSWRLLLFIAINMYWFIWHWPLRGLPEDLIAKY